MNKQPTPEQVKENIEQGRVFFYSGGKQTVKIGDKFNWNGVQAGIYEVVGWGTLSGVYSPSGLGGTSSVFVRDEKFVVHEWCGDSVASGVAQSLLTPVQDGREELVKQLLQLRNTFYNGVRSKNEEEYNSACYAWNKLNGAAELISSMLNTEQNVQASVATEAESSNTDDNQILPLISKEEIEIPFPTSEKHMRDGREIKTWMDGWETGYKAALNNKP